VFVRQHLRMLPTTEDRAELAAITAAGRERQAHTGPDRSYPLAEVAKGLRYVEAGHAHGKVVITFAQSTLA
jgi:hypothetical protein